MGTRATGWWSRRRVIAALVAAGAFVWRPVAAFARACRGTLAADEGPFYPRVPIPFADDLTRREPDGPRAAGTPLEFAGRVLDPECRPLDGAIVEIWQCDANGNYDHPNSGGGAKLDPAFRYFAKARTDREGRYRFQTIRPSRYRVGTLERAPHIHFKVRHERFAVFTSEVYFPGTTDAALRLEDRVFQSRGPRRDELIATLATTDQGLVARFDIELA